MPDDASVNLASVSLASVRQRLSAALTFKRSTGVFFDPRVFIFGAISSIFEILSSNFQ